MTKPKRPLPLQLKLTVALVLIVMTPLAVSAYFIGQLGKAAANVAAGEAQARTAILEKSIDAYHELVRTKKNLHHEVASRLANRPELINAAAGGADIAADLKKLVSNEPGLRALAVLRPDGTPISAAAACPFRGFGACSRPCAISSGYVCTRRSGTTAR